MAAFDFYTTANILIFTHPRGPSFPVEAGPRKNIVHSTTVGGKIKSQVRGSDRWHCMLRWRWITAAHLASFLTWHATYGGMQAPFKLELLDGLTDLPGGTLLQVRNMDIELDYQLMAFAHYEVTIELIEDLPRQLGTQFEDTVSLVEAETLQAGKVVGDAMSLEETLIAEKLP